MKRREFIKRSSQALALAAASSAVGYAFHNRDNTRYVPIAIKTRSFTVPEDPNLPKISIARNEDHIAGLRQTLDALGGIKRFVKPGERVTIKPNIGWDRVPAQAANTNPVLVGEMVRQCLAAGASEVIVTDVSCNDPRRSFLRSGIRRASEDAGARVILPRDEDFVKTVVGGELIGDWPVLKHFVNTDRLINMPITKQHSLSLCTVAMKNLYGVLGGRRAALHQDIDQSIVDLASFCLPTLTVVDATRILLRGGPQGGSLDDVAVEDCVICATDQVAADARAVEFLGLTAADVGHIVLAQKAGLGNLDYRSAGYREIV